MRYKQTKTKFQYKQEKFVDKALRVVMDQIETNPAPVTGFLTALMVIKFVVDYDLYNVLVR